MENTLSGEEKVTLQLKSLYKSYGFSAYKLGSFEEYSLYARNIDFLVSRNVATFNADGRLLALRPDVTLSIIKNVAPEEGQTIKLYYDEKVYRAPLGSKNFREVSQVGAEVIGEVDGVAEAEVLSLALETLQTVGGNYLLNVAHIGVITAFLAELGLSAEDEREALGYLRNKNAHGFAAFAREKRCPPAAAEAFIGLMNLDGEPRFALAGAEEICKSEGARRALGELKEIIRLSGKEKNINVNFSIADNATYYNGVIFSGYVEGVPRSVLSGGRYDKLLKNFGKSAGAIGFALYLGELSGYLKSEQSAAEIAVVYKKEGRRALGMAEALRKKGKSVLVCKRPPHNFAGTIINAEEEV